MRELTNSEFRRVSRGLANARQMLEMGYPKEALLELRPVKKLLEQDGISTRILALAYQCESKARIQLQQMKAAQKCLLRALEILNHIEDQTSLRMEIQTELLQLQNQ